MPDRPKPGIISRGCSCVSNWIKSYDSFSERFIMKMDTETDYVGS